MREIKFRGKCEFRDGWVYGFYSPLIWYPSHEQTPSIKELTGGDVQIKLETLGQYTGLKDKNGKEIYEGDIIIFNKNRNLPNYISVPEVVKYHQRNCSFQRYPYGIAVTTGGAGKLLQSDMMSECEVIGNIYDNPELLEVEE